MAESVAITLVATPIVDLVIKKLASRAWNELKSLCRLDTRGLETSLAKIMYVLEEAERRPVAADSTPALYRWLSKLKDAAYDADDVVYECHAEVLRQKTESKVSGFLSFNNNNTFAFRRRMSKKLKDVMKTLTEIEEDQQWHVLNAVLQQWLVLKAQRQTAGAEILDQGRRTSSVLIPTKIYGREDDQEKVKDYLINEGKNEQVTVVAIVGLGGIGKTTLAQSIYNDETIIQEFDRRLWVWVSTDFRVETILRNMIEHITGETCSLVHIDPLHQHLRGLLGGSRFLLVLDDVWNEDEDQWRRLQSHLRLGEKGSKILVTARCVRVARTMRCNHMHQLKTLSDDDCWEIFKGRAFGANRVEETPNLEQIGREIAKKSGGLPLAAEALGSYLGTGKLNWLEIQRTKMWRLPEERTKILSALKLCYHHMPSDLKQCFAYCSLFPKSYKLRKEKIICLWSAEGFIPSIAEGLLGVGSADSSYLDSLLEIHFLQDAERHHNGTVIACQMHDVVHELACSLARDEFMFAIEDNIKSRHTWTQSSCRYLSIIFDNSSLDSLNNSSCKIDKVRSFVSLPQERNPRRNLTEDNWKMLLKLSLLRVLDLSFIDISELPPAIRYLQLLRHLNLSSTNIRKLPHTITSLYYLLTLNLAYCRRLEELPSGLSTMKSLKHLDVYGCDSLTCMPALGPLKSNLRVLTMFIVGTTEGHTIKELQHVKITGRLQIKNLHNVNGQEGARRVNLESKDLQQLELHWNESCDIARGETSRNNARDVLEGLKPCPNLEELTISGYGGIQFPDWMSADGLRGVTELSLVNCEVSALSSWREGLKSFISLRKLKISNCGKLRCLPDNITQLHISSLRILDISDNENLTSLVEKEEEQDQVPILFASLQSLMLGKCKSMVKLPEWLDRLTSLKSLDLSACCNLGTLRQLKPLVGRASITLCPDLARRCKEEIDEDWNMPIVSITITEETQLGGEQEIRNNLPSISSVVTKRDSASRLTAMMLR